MSNSKISSQYLQYIPPKLTQGVEWYISYYAIYPETGKLRRVRVKINCVKPLSLRKLVARRLMSEITEKLLKGWNPFIERAAPKSFHLLFSVIETFLAVKEKETEPTSLRAYKSYCKKLKSWLVENGYNKDMYISTFTARTAADLMLSIKSDPRVSPTSYNNHLFFYRVLWNWMIQYNYATTNYFTTINKLPKKLTEKKRIILTEKNRIELKNYLLEHNKIFFVMCLFCYHCLLRTKEIASLKVNDINIHNQTVRVRAEIAKNDKESFRTIPDSMIPYLLDLNLSAPGNYYLFGDGPGYMFAPGAKKIDSKKIAKYWSNHIRPALGWGLELQFYSLKDTGITNMLSAGIPVNYVQGQADHSSIEITSVYTRKTVQAQEIVKKADAF